MDNDKNSSKDKDIPKTNTEQARINANQANTIATLKNELKKKEDPNAEPKIIQKGSQKHPKYQRNDIKIAATIPKKTVAAKV